MKNRVDFVTPTRQQESPYLSILLEAAVHQQALLIEYGRGEMSHAEEYNRSAFMPITACGFARHIVFFVKAFAYSVATVFIRRNMMLTDRS